MKGTNCSTPGEAWSAAVAGTELQTAVKSVIAAFGHVLESPGAIATVGVVLNPANPLRRRVKLTLVTSGTAAHIEDDAVAIVESRWLGSLRAVEIVWLHDPACDRGLGCVCGLGLLRELRAAFEGGVEDYQAAGA